MTNFPSKSKIPHRHSMSSTSSSSTSYPNYVGGPGAPMYPTMIPMTAYHYPGPSASAVAHRSKSFNYGSRPSQMNPYHIYGNYVHPVAGMVMHSSSFNSGTSRLLPYNTSDQFHSSLPKNVKRRSSSAKVDHPKYRVSKKNSFYVKQDCVPHHNNNNNNSLTTNKNVSKQTNTLPKESSKNLPSYPNVLPTSFGYTSSSRLQPPDGVNYREPPILNDKLFPRDEEIGIAAPPGFKSPHLQMRGIVVETKTSKEGGLTPLLDGISMEIEGGELMAVMTTSGE